MIKLSDWIPDFVRPILKNLVENPACLDGERRAVFEQLVSDERMKPVYEQFVRRNRETGEFLYPASTRTAGQSADDAQRTAIRELLQLAISAAADRISVSKLDEIERAKERWEGHAAQLRALAHDMDLALKLGALGLNDPRFPGLAWHDAQALLRVANWVEHLSSAMRRPGDPLIVDRHRGDPVVRGVQIMVGVKLEEQFGVRLDGTAATLTSVALGADTSPRASRSALTTRNPKKKRSAP